MLGKRLIARVRTIRVLLACPRAGMLRLIFERAMDTVQHAAALHNCRFQLLNVLDDKLRTIGSVGGVGGVGGVCGVGDLALARPVGAGRWREFRRA